MLAADQVPVALIDRAVFELTPAERAKHRLRDAIIHTVIPVRVTDRFVAYHDPRIPRVMRKTIRLFRCAYAGLGGNCVVCSLPHK